MRRVLDLPNDWHEACRRVAPWYKSASGPVSRVWDESIAAWRTLGTRHLWHGDELYTTAKLDALAARERDTLVQVDSSDYLHFHKNAWLYSADMLRAGRIRDVNLPLPYARHKTAIDRVAAGRGMPPLLAPAVRFALRCKAFVIAPSRRRTALSRVVLYAALCALYICARLTGYTPLLLAVHPLQDARHILHAAGRDGHRRIARCLLWLGRRALRLAPRPRKKSPRA